MPDIRFTNSAQRDFLDLWLNIAEENPIAADQSVDSIYTTLTLISTQLEMGRLRPELAVGLRSFPSKTPYIIFYTSNENSLLVVRILHHARDIDIEYFS